MQGTAGNRAVQRLLKGGEAPVQRIPSEDEPVAGALSAYGSNYGNYAGGGGAEPPAATPAAAAPADAAAASAYNYLGAAAEPQVAPPPAAGAALAGAPSAYGSNYGNYAGGGAEPPAASAPGLAAGSAITPGAAGYDYVGGGAPPQAQSSAAAPFSLAFSSSGSAAAATPAAATPAAASTPAAAEARPAPVAGPGGLPALRLPPKYDNEQNEAGWRTWLGTDPSKMTPEQMASRTAASKNTNIRTRHYSEEEQAERTLTPEMTATAGGASKVLMSGGMPANLTKSEYAMSPTGAVVARKEDEGTLRTQAGQDLDPTKVREAFRGDFGAVETTHHSTMLAGGDAAHAGHVGVKEGKVNYLDDDSGHYRPDEAHTLAAFNELSSQGVLDPTSATGRVKLSDKSGQKGVNRGSDDVSVHFSGYQQAGGNEEAIRAKNAVTKSLGTEQRAARRASPVDSRTPARTGAEGIDSGASEITPSKVSERQASMPGAKPSPGWLTNLKASNGAKRGEGAAAAPDADVSASVDVPASVEAARPGGMALVPESEPASEAGGPATPSAYGVYSGAQAEPAPAPAAVPQADPREFEMRQAEMNARRRNQIFAESGPLTPEERGPSPDVDFMNDGKTRPRR